MKYPKDPRIFCTQFFESKVGFPCISLLSQSNLEMGFRASVAGERVLLKDGKCEARSEFPSLLVEAVRQAGIKMMKSLLNAGAEEFVAVYLLFLRETVSVK